MRHLVDNLQRKLQLCSCHGNLLDVQVAQRTYLVGEQKLLENHSVFCRPYLDNARLALVGPFGQRAPLALPHRLLEQAIGLAATFVGRDEVSLVVEKRVDGLLRNERNNFHNMARTFLKRLQFFGGEDHELPLFKLVSLFHVGARNDFAGGLRYVLLLDPAALRRQQVETNAGCAVGGRIQFYRYRHQTE